MSDLQIPTIPKVTLWHNPECSKSRRVVELLEILTVEVTLFLYLETPPDEAKIRELLGMLKKPAGAIARKREPLYKELGLEHLSEDKLIKALVANPSLIERPIGVARGKAIVGRPPEIIMQLLIPELPAGKTADDMLRDAMQGKL